ncbi:9944_t:CDS:2 [Diversispora eburnea]|uniref:9944_t:CDS:1 n=1 Tax=Diversispora eburnea TaxID=1213867 RepID=A0A9N8VGY9_9GLOM|nr:9944_t:CDS:2 [Diversispora eburnea]
MTANNVHQKGVDETARLLGGNFDDNDNKSLHDNTYYHSQPLPTSTISFLPLPLPQQPKEFVAFLLLNTEFPSYHEEIKWQEDATRINSIAYFIYQKQYIDYLEQQKIKITTNIQETIKTEWEKESKSAKDSYFAFSSECEILYLKAKNERKSVQLQALQEDRQLQTACPTSSSPQFNSIIDNFFPPMSSIQPRPPPRNHYDDDTLPEDMGPSLF